MEEKVNGMKEEGVEEKVNAAAYDWLQCIVTALVSSILVFVFVGRLIGVDGHSMNPTLYDGDLVAMSNIFYEPKAGDIVVLTKKSFGSEPLVKRVIATEGQEIDIDFETGEVRVDGVKQTEEYIAELTKKSYDLTFPLVVEEGCVFVMGDNRNNSLDSRSSMVGMVDRRCVLGRVYAVVYPFTRVGLKIAK